MAAILRKLSGRRTVKGNCRSWWLHRMIFISSTPDEQESVHRTRTSVSFWSAVQGTGSIFYENLHPQALDRLKLMESVIVLNVPILRVNSLWYVHSTIIRQMVARHSSFIPICAGAAGMEVLMYKAILSKQALKDLEKLKRAGAGYAKKAQLTKGLFMSCECGHIYE